MERMRPANGIDQKRLSPAPSRWGDPASTMRVLKPLACRGASEARHRWQGGAYSPPAPLSKEERTTNYPSFPQIQTALDTAGRHLVCPNSAASLSFSFIVCPFCHVTVIAAQLRDVARYTSSFIESQDVCYVGIRFCLAPWLGTYRAK